MARIDAIPREAMSEAQRGVHDGIGAGRSGGVVSGPFGIDPAIATAMRERREPSFTKEDEATVYALAGELMDSAPFPTRPMRAPSPSRARIRRSVWSP
jgi:hypothetical protein